jgi:signal peptide peptidase SppA
MHDFLTQSRFNLDDVRGGLRGLASGLLSIDAARAPEVMKFLSDTARGEHVSDNRLRMLARPKRSALIQARAATSATGGGKLIAIVSVKGVATFAAEYQPYCFSTSKLALTVTSLAADTNVGAIVLDIDSPGGMVTGTPEAADAIFAARKRKDVVALVNPLAASAAYWLASQCTTITATKSGDAGSVGVFLMHVDHSKMLNDAGVRPTFIFAGKYKTEGNAYEPLTNEARAYYQGEIDRTHSQFICAIARGRNISASTVRERFGQGRCLTADDALRVGMIDAIRTPQEAVNELAAGRSATASAYRARLERLAKDPEPPAKPTTVAPKRQADTYRQRLAILSA